MKTKSVKQKIKQKNYNWNFIHPSISFVHFFQTTYLLTTTMSCSDNVGWLNSWLLVVPPPPPQATVSRLGRLTAGMTEWRFACPALLSALLTLTLPFCHQWKWFYFCLNFVAFSFFNVYTIYSYLLLITVCDNSK